MYIWYWKILWTHRNKLPEKLEIKNPKLQYEGMSGAFFWEDENLWELRYPLTEPFKSVLCHRTKLVLGTQSQIENFSSSKFDKSIFQLAKNYFPDWIGFEESRCTYHPKSANRMIRILKVADWRMEKLMNEDYD
ncbi:hypothetical protein DDD_0065 [Nonlabens dokdonensis DSW-6]|uniref:Uncharacterized protein n=1 Tax=Nonlabens dokdonensis (strain DSM 17205 / KCTC 12402 / DSW-6) TaxID=592029 RepID=L7W4V9_NONDD|nr:hypothetical protein DDD_0065 [Nonlabens dokdonensis DSW-6]